VQRDGWLGERVVGGGRRSRAASQCRLFLKIFAFWSCNISVLWYSTFMTGTKETTTGLIQHFRERYPNLQPSDIEWINGSETRFRICTESGIDILPVSGRIQESIVEDFDFRGRL
jgi:hypothetical protein